MDIGVSRFVVDGSHTSYDAADVLMTLKSLSKVVTVRGEQARRNAGNERRSNLAEDADPPRRRRRKEARPSEIVDAAMSVFAENGYAAANLNEVAQRANVAKGTLYLYFKTKEDLFRAVARAAIAANLAAVERAATVFRGSIRELVPMLLKASAEGLDDSRIPAIARMVIGESRQFPDLARIWHDDVAARMLRLLTGMLSEAQERGEIKHGDPRLQAFSLIGPVVLAVLFREVFGPSSELHPNLQALADSHADIVLSGLVAPAA